jgi:hypothetical protein
MATAEPVGPRTDLVCGLLLAVGTLGYVWLWPFDLYLFDEGMVLYEARRISQGAVLYSRIFEIITPGFLYLMAGAFTLFGASMEVARVVMALIHIGIQCLIYLVARRLGARPAVALLAAAAELALSYASMPQANPHWLSTLAGLAMLLALLRADTRRRAFWFGVGCGLCLLIQQHRGTGMLAGVVAVQVLDAWSGSVGWGAFVRQALARISLLAAGVAVTVVAGLAPLLIAAGPEALYDSLVRFPLRNYRQHHQGMVWWGLAFPPFMAIGFVVRWLPLLIPVALARGAVGLLRRQPVDAWRPLLVTAILAATTTAMMWYYPDFVHLAVAVPITLALAAEAIERVVGLAGRRRLLGAALLAPVAAGIAWMLVDNLNMRRAWYSLRTETAFGTVHFSSSTEAAAMQIIARGLDSAPRRETFAYPYGASLYLIADAVNPTRFQFLTPSYSDAAQIHEALRTIEHRQVPYVFVMALSLDWARDPVIRYLKKAYDRVPLPPADDRLLYAVYKRKPGVRVRIPPIRVPPPPRPPAERRS